MRRGVSVLRRGLSLSCYPAVVLLATFLCIGSQFLSFQPRSALLLLGLDDVTSTTMAVVVETNTFVTPTNTTTSRLAQDLNQRYFSHKDMNLPEPPNTPGAYIHIGKAGGSTMSYHLRNACHSWVKKPCHVVDNETRISQLSTYYHTPDFASPANLQTKYDFYVVHLRNPLKRFISIFSTYHLGNKEFRPKKDRFARSLKRRKLQRRFSRCFASLQDFATAVGCEMGNQTTTKINECPGYALDVVTQNVEFSPHWYWNHYLVYQEALLPNPSFSKATILALRTDNLWDDWISANQYLGQAHVALPSNMTRQRWSSRFELPVSTEISLQAQQHLCWALRSDFQAYLTLLGRAANLSPIQKLASLEDCQASCPWLNLTLDVSSSSLDAAAAAAES